MQPATETSGVERPPARLEWHGIGPSGPQTPSNAMVGCVYTTEFPQLRAYWRRKGVRPRAPLGTNATPDFYLGGGLALFDGLTGRPTHFCPFPAPSTMHALPDGVVVANQSGLARYRWGELSHVVSHRWMNDLRSVEVLSDRYLVAASGLDLVLEVDEDGAVTWQWWAGEHGYVHTPLGEMRTIDKAADHRGRDVPTLQQTTHLNSVIIDGDHGQLLVALFHQGEILRVDKATGDCSVVLDGLRAPHSLRREPFGYSLADSGNGRILLLDADLRLVEAIDEPMEWVIDSAVAGGRRWLVDNNGCQLVSFDVDGGRHQRCCAAPYEEAWGIRRLERVGPDWVDRMTSETPS